MSYMFLRKSANMALWDRAARTIAGFALVYFGLIAQALSDSATVNAVAGLFGLTNVIAAAAGVCPGYLLTRYSTLNEKEKETSDQSIATVAAPAENNEVKSITRKILLSVAVPVFIFLSVISFLLYDLSHDLSMSKDSTSARTAALVGLKLSDLHQADGNRDLSQDKALYEALAVSPVAVVFHLPDGTLLDSPFQKLPADPLLIEKLVSPEAKNGDSMLMHAGMHLIKVRETLGNGTIATTLSHVQDHSDNTGKRVWSRLFFIAFIVFWAGGWGAYYILRKFTQSMIIHSNALKYRSMHDPLTGLPNRLGMEEILSERVSSTEGKTESFPLLLIDVADFRYFNDTLGYEIGDELLKLVSSRLQDSLSDGETIIRMSSDVFCVIGPIGHDRTFAARLANKLHDIIEAPMEVKQIALDLRCYIGMSMYPLHSDEGPELVRLADIALDQAKNSRNRTVYYQAEKDSHSIRKLSLLAGLRTAIDDEQLNLVYQPKINIANGNLSGVEALVRWQHPIYKNVSPLEFIGWAEKTGLIDKLTGWVLESAAQQSAQWQENGYKIPIAVNLSPVNLQNQTILDLVQQLVTSGEFANNLLELELTENAVMEDPASALESMMYFKDLGVNMAIDDFGTGLASFSYLRKFPVSNLKIDRMFVMDSISEARDEVLLRSMIELGHNLDCVVTAEGVEDAETLELLKKFGCDFAQGYHMCKPTSPAEVIEWLHRDDSSGRQAESRKAA